MCIKTNFWVTTTVIVFWLGIISCGSEETQTTEDDSTDSTTVEVIIDDEEDDYAFILPSPLQIASIFKRSGLTYADGITNSVDNATNYSSNLSKSLNFGVYSADLSYCVLNNQAQHALKYLKAVKQLAGDLGMSSIFNTDKLFKSFEKNIGNEDSTIYILILVQEQIDDYLQENEQDYEGPVFFAGAWIEGMYIGSKLADDQNNHRLAIRIVEQMSVLDNLMEGLRRYPNKTEELDEFISDLGAIKNIYLDFDAIQGQHEDDIDFETITVSDDELNRMASKIEEIRTKIVND